MPRRALLSEARSNSCQRGAAQGELQKPSRLRAWGAVPPPRGRVLSSAGCSEICIQRMQSTGPRESRKDLALGGQPTQRAVQQLHQPRHRRPLPSHPQHPATAEQGASNRAEAAPRGGTEAPREPCSQPHACPAALCRGRLAPLALLPPWLPPARRGYVPIAGVEAIPAAAIMIHKEADLFLTSLK